MKPNPIIRRTSDGALFEVVSTEHSTCGIHLFHRVEWKQSGWWPFKRWVRTGEVYIPEDDRDWEVVS